MDNKLNYIEIKSKGNKNYKKLKNLGNKNGRKKIGQYVCEGKSMLYEAFNSHVVIQDLYINNSFLNTQNNELIKKVYNYGYNNKLNTYLLSDDLFNKLSFTENPQGILFTVKQKSNLDKLDFTNKESLYIICNSIQDPGNIGTIIRTSDAVDADGVIITKGCVDPYNPKAVRATMGSIFHIPIIFYNDIYMLIKEMKDYGVKIYASSPNTKNMIYDTDFNVPLAIILGNEANGIDNSILNLSDEIIKIPLPGKAESLNVSVAAGVIMYEVLRQRMTNFL